MSEDKVAVKAEEGHHHHHPEVEIEKIETSSAGTTPWGVRLALGVLGILLLAAAFAGWIFRDSLHGQLAEALPWLIGGAVLLGAGAIMESITTEIWLALIAGVVALAVTFLIVGRTAVYPSVGQSMFVVDRFSGDVQLCTIDGCKQLARVATLPKPPAPPAAVVQAVQGILPPPPPPPGALPPPAQSPVPAPATAAPAKSTPK